MNTPEKNCFQKFCVDRQSSKTKTRERLSWTTATTASESDMPRACVALKMMSTSATKMQSV